MTALDFLQDWQRDRWNILQAIGKLDALAAKVDLTLDPSFEPTYLDGQMWPLNPRYTSPRLNPRNFVHVMGSGGEPVRLLTRQAMRIYNWYGRDSLATESVALLAYYDHPDDARVTDHAIIAAPIAHRIRGRVAYNGALYLDESLRGPRPELDGVHPSQLVSALSRLLAVYLYDVDWCVATTPKAHYLKGISERYGWAGIAHPSHAERIGDLDNEVHLMWSRREDIIAEAERINSEGLKPVES